MTTAITPASCGFCGESAGWCSNAGGPNPCEGDDERVLLEAEAIRAPQLRYPIRPTKEKTMSLDDQTVALDEAAADAPAPAAVVETVPVWISTWRRGIDHHVISPDDPGHTLCGRPMHSGQAVTQLPDESQLCKRCAATLEARAEWAADQSEPVPLLEQLSPDTAGLLIEQGVIVPGPVRAFTTDPEPDVAAPDPGPRTRPCEISSCETILPEDEALSGYMRCHDHDSDGEHLAADYVASGRTGVGDVLPTGHCIVCGPERGAAPVDETTAADPAGATDSDVATCRVCGCTDEQACDGGCWWVADPEGMGDVCSRCAEGLAAAAETPAAQPVEGEPAEDALPSGAPVAVGPTLTAASPAGAAGPTARAKASPAPVRRFARGELRDAVLSHLQTLPAGQYATVAQVAAALEAHAAPVATNLQRMALRGDVVKSTGDGPAAYRMKAGQT